MAPLEWLTPDRVMKSMGLLAGLGHLGIGMVNLFLGFRFPDDFVLFGVDALLIIGGGQVVAGIFFLISEYKFRPRVPSQKSE